MDLFTVIDDAVAIVRLPKGVEKQVKMYHRGDRVYVPHAGGFIRIAAWLGDRYVTSHPDIRVTEYDAPGVVIEKGAPTFVGTLKVAA